MQASPSTESTIPAAIRNGLLFGAISAAIYFVSAFIQDVTGTTVALVTVGSTVTPLFFLDQASLILALVLFFVAGLRTARVDVTLSSGAVAGLVAALMVSVVDIATQVVNEEILYSSTITRLGNENRLVLSGFHAVMFGTPAYTVLTVIIYVALGSGLGFVAGILQSQIRQQALWRQ
jgi:hypothetical protein